MIYIQALVGEVPAGIGTGSVRTLKSQWATATVWESSIFQVWYSLVAVLNLVLFRVSK
jgi:hypothetical protein